MMNRVCKIISKIMVMGLMMGILFHSMEVHSCFACIENVNRSVHTIEEESNKELTSEICTGQGLSQQNERPTVHKERDRKLSNSIAITYLMQHAVKQGCNSFQYISVTDGQTELEHRIVSYIEKSDGKKQ